jgi:hypothetical protein
MILIDYGSSAIYQIASGSGLITHLVGAKTLFAGCVLSVALLISRVSRGIVKGTFISLTRIEHYDTNYG